MRREENNKRSSVHDCSVIASHPTLLRYGARSTMPGVNCKHGHTPHRYRAHVAFIIYRRFIVGLTYHDCSYVQRQGSNGPERANATKDANTILVKLLCYFLHSEGKQFKREKGVELVKCEITQLQLLSWSCMACGRSGRGRLCFW